MKLHLKILLKLLLAVIGTAVIAYNKIFDYNTYLGIALGWVLKSLAQDIASLPEGTYKRVLERIINFKFRS